MSIGDKIPYAVALETAQALATSLSIVCERVLIAGSLRRQKEEVGDLELVVLPKTEAIHDLFGDVIGQRSLLDAALVDIAPVRTKDGERYKQFSWEGLPVDLFIATWDTWGCVATIRTGSADFTRWLVTNRRHGGACPSHLNFKDGRLWQGETALETTEELDVFDALGQPWVEPVERISGRWR